MSQPSNGGRARRSARNRASLEQIHETVGSSRLSTRIERLPPFGTASWRRSGSTASPSRRRTLTHSSREHPITSVSMALERCGRGGGVARVPWAAGEPFCSTRCDPGVAARSDERRDQRQRRESQVSPGAIPSG
jgi:hypothetical protein